MQPDDQGYLQFNVCSHCEEIEQSLESLKLTENGSNTGEYRVLLYKLYKLPIIYVFKFLTIIDKCHT